MLGGSAMVSGKTEKPAGYWCISCCRGHLCGSLDVENRARLSYLAVWQAVYAAGQPNLLSGLVSTPEVPWRLAKRRNLRGFGWWERVLRCMGRRLACRVSVEYPIQRYGAPFLKSTPLFCSKTGVLSRFEPGWWLNKETCWV